jgi:1-acyl-sn-glycerol-3-phosphate acyltransferase
MENLVFFLLVILFLLVMGRYFLVACKRENAADWGSSLLNTMDGMNRLFCRHYHRLSPVDIPVAENESAIIVSNHISGLDPLLILASVKRPVRFLIASEQYYRFGFTWLFRLVGCIPIDRSKKADNSMRLAIKALDEGEVLVIFPQGKIHLPTEPKVRLKPGAARLASKLNCKITPVRLAGVACQGRVLSPVVIRGKAQINVCPIIDASKHSIEEINKKIMSCIT